MIERHLARFRRRVRWMRAWKSFGIGLAAGGVLGAVWSGLDWAGIWYTEWLWLGLVALACAVAGGVIGLVLPIDLAAIADSVDRRAGLENRIGTALERHGEDGFDPLVREDAEKRLAGLKGSTLFPVRLGRWHVAAAVALALCAGLFLLGNTPLLLKADERADREKLKEAGKAVERVVKPMDKQSVAPNEAQKRLADEYRRFAKDLERGRVDREKALQKANELAKKAEELAKERAQQAKNELAKADSAWQKMQKAELDRAGMTDIDPELAKMSPEEMETAEKQARSELEELEKEMQKGADMSPAALDALNKKMAKLRKQIELSENVRKMLERMRNDPLFKEIQELAKKLKKAATDSEQGEPIELTDADIKAMLDRLEELAEQLKDDAAMKEYLEALKKAIEEMKECGSCNGAGIGLLGLLGLGGNGGRSQDEFFSNTGQINKLDKEEAGQGSTKTTVVSGEKRDEGEETYIEVRGPAKLGARSSVPYKKVLPSYKKKAEEALRRQSIPKEHEKRVREYFDSLGK